MSGADRGRNERSGRRDGARPNRGSGSAGAGRPSSGRPQRSGGKPGQRSGGKPRERNAKSGERNAKSGDYTSRGPKNAGRGKPTGRSQPYQRDDRARGGRARDDRKDREERTSDQKIYDGPPIPDDISAKDLDKHARQALQSVPEKLAERIARHLVMAGLLIEEDPETAHLHALAARARASRNGMIREACGETAYAAGKFAEALSEFRAARRMNGGLYYAPMMADCERALKRSEKALTYDTPEVRAALDDAGNIELTIVIAGARRDLGQTEAAIRLLETEPLHSQSRADWVARLRYAYADALLEAGRTEEAINWFHRTVAVDGNRQTDAEERLEALGEAAS